MGLCARRDFSQAWATQPGRNTDGCEADIDIFVDETQHRLQRVKHELVSRVEKNQWDYLLLV